MAPTITMISILYLYAFIALLLGLAAMVTSTRSPHIIKLQDDTGVSVIELAHLRLTQPLTLVASLFPEGDDESRAMRSVTTTAVDLFDEQPGGNIKRVRVGFRRVGSGKEFGTWKADFD